MSVKCTKRSERRRLSAGRDCSAERAAGQEVRRCSSAAQEQVSHQFTTIHHESLAWVHDCTESGPCLAKHPLVTPWRPPNSGLSCRPAPAGHCSVRAWRTPSERSQGFATGLHADCVQRETGRRAVVGPRLAARNMGNCSTELKPSVRVRREGSRSPVRCGDRSCWRRAG